MYIEYINNSIKRVLQSQHMAGTMWALIEFIDINAGATNNIVDPYINIPNLCD